MYTLCVYVCPVETAVYFEVVPVDSQLEDMLPRVLSVRRVLFRQSGGNFDSKLIAADFADIFKFMFWNENFYFFSFLFFFCTEFH